MEFTLKYRARIVIKAISPHLSKGKKVLDIGCGNGVISHEIEKFFNCDLTGTDIFSYLKRDIKFKPMQKCDELDFDDNEFDTGLFIEVLHHIPFGDQIKIIKEAMRVCREVLVFELRPTLIAKARDFLMNKIHCRNMPVPLTHREKEGWMQLFGDNGIAFKFYDIKKFDILCPATNYLFHLKRP